MEFPVENATFHERDTEGKSSFAPCYCDVYLPVPADSSTATAANPETTKDKAHLWRKTARCLQKNLLPEEKLQCPDLLHRYVPLTSWLPKYDVRKNLIRDLVSGATVGTLAVPQALGYAIVAGVAPIFGLYTSFIPPLIYTLLGTSRHVSVGTFALVALMCGEAVSDVMDRQSRVGQGAAPGNSSAFGAVPEGVNATSSSLVDDWLQSGRLVTPSEAASVLAFTVGLWQILLGVCGLGALTIYLSDRVVKGFACGAAVHIFCTQLKWIFGLTIPRHRGYFSLPYALWDFFRLLPTTHLPTLAVSAVCLAALVSARFLNQNARVMKVIRFPVPMELFVIIFGSLTSYLMDLRSVYQVDTVRSIPLGLPQAHLPPFFVVPEILADAFIIAVVSFSMAASAGRIFAQKHDYKIDGNQELRALGAACLFSSFFQCFPSSVALARSMVQESTGGKTQVVSLVMGGVVVLVITLLGPFLEPIPKACLGCIIVVALSASLMSITDVARLWMISPVEALMFLVPFVSIVLLDVEIGLLIGVVFSLFATVIFRSQTAKVDLLIPRSQFQQEAVSLQYEYRYDQLICGDQTVQASTCRILRVNGPLYFANAELCLTRIRRLAFSFPALEPRPRYTNEKSEEPTNGLGTEAFESNKVFLDTNRQQALILDMVAVSFLDMSGVEMVKKLLSDTTSRSMTLYLASVSAESQDLFDRSSLKATKTASGTDNLVLVDSIHDAIKQLDSSQG